MQIDSPQKDDHLEKKVKMRPKKILSEKYFHQKICVKNSKTVKNSVKDNNEKEGEKNPKKT